MIAQLIHPVVTSVIFLRVLQKMSSPESQICNFPGGHAQDTENYIFQKCDSDQGQISKMYICNISEN